jgi:hypothetical protein
MWECRVLECFADFAEEQNDGIPFAHSLVTVSVLLSSLEFFASVISRCCRRGDFIEPNNTANDTGPIGIVDNEFLYGLKSITQVKCCRRRLLTRVRREDDGKLSECEVRANEADGWSLPHGWFP